MGFLKRNSVKNGVVSQATDANGEITVTFTVAYPAGVVPKVFLTIIGTVCYPIQLKQDPTNASFIVKVFTTSHYHTNPSTGFAGDHQHSYTTGGPSATAGPVVWGSAGSACTTGLCVTNFGTGYVASETHTHSGTTGFAGNHQHSVGNTGSTSLGVLASTAVKFNWLAMVI